ncbi:MAG: M24 family metallopeptidase, partial [Actinomycetota bacterium]|nr:M24 family metallopeptidase [Actinomycetota bacterium]
MSPPDLPALQVGPRLDALRVRCGELGIDSILITDPANVRYLTGFTGSAGRVGVTETAAVLATDGRYAEQAESELALAGVNGSVAVCVGTVPKQDAALAQLLAAGRVGLEADTISWADARSWTELLDSSEVAPVSDVLVPIRAVKDVGEVARIEAAARIADAALAECAPMLGEGPTELEFARRLDQLMLTGGAEALSFDTICAAGPNGASPHARPSSRRVREGDLVVVDFGAVIEGYHSDMTRTFVVG